MTPPMPIVVVDDDDAWRELVGLAAGACHAGPVREFADGEAALAAHAASAPEATLWLVDLHMPRMPGLEVVTRLRALQPQALVAVVSAAATEQERTACLAVGAMAVVRKPAAFGDVVERLRDLLLLAERRAAAPP
jgi:DNA-binding response OmpR family regulator